MYAATRLKKIRPVQTIGGKNVNTAIITKIAPNMITFIPMIPFIMLGSVCLIIR